ncbi:VCBS domain-containing protein, partial [Desulfovibrio sp. An276]|uniref:VCBS domain-containing protein n=1 Tax=Desulfovibrio sp. An276 TaxID=1965618 RepID=UPI0019526D71
VPDAEDASATVHESGLNAGGTEASTDKEITSGEITLTLNGEAATVTIGGKEFAVDASGNASVAPEGVSIDTGEGTLLVTGISDGKVSYTYTLKEHQTHAQGEGNNTMTDEIAINVTDATGDEVNGNLAITIVDDVPTANNDVFTLTEASAQKGATDGGNVLSNDLFGADEPGSKTVTSIEGGTLGEPVQGKHGEFTLNADGSYSYKLNEGVNIPKGETFTETFTYTITDTDGDTSQATITINITGDESVPVINVPDAEDASATVHESGLNAGGTEASTDKEITSGEITL